MYRVSEMYGSLTSLVETAKNVFHQHDNDADIFENHVFHNYLTDFEDNEPSTSDTILRSKRITRETYTNKSLDNKKNVQQRRFSMTESVKTNSSTSQYSLAPTTSLSTSLRSLSPSRKQATSNGSTTAKNEQQSSTATGVAVNALSAAATSTTEKNEKEKKRKEVSSSRVKKFHRHFVQIPKDEKLINYYSCALVSDILLQGHLYITDKHFAFYSNVFGYVTKVVIPTSSVTKISKEKTAKIIPNAVGVATADERHVFASFISREAAFRLMCSVCPIQVPVVPELAPKLLPVTDIEISEEYSIEDDSSCSISGNESPPQPLDGNTAGLATLTIADPSGSTLVRRTIASSSLSIVEGKLAGNNRMSSPEACSTPNRHSNVILRSSGGHGATAFYQNSNSAPATGAAASAATNLTMIVAGTASSTSSSTSNSSSSSPTTIMSTTSTSKAKAMAAADTFKQLTKKVLSRFKFPDELHVVYLGVLLSFILAVFSVFLLWRILDIESKTSAYRSPLLLDWHSRTDEDIFTEALRWQKELQAKSTEEAQIILNSNLEQIAKVRRSLETLSMLIHDRSGNAFDATHRDDSD